MDYFIEQFAQHAEETNVNNNVFHAFSAISAFIHCRIMSNEAKASENTGSFLQISLAVFFLLLALRPFRPSHTKPDAGKLTKFFFILAHVVLTAISTIISLVTVLHLLAFANVLFRGWHVDALRAFELCPLDFFQLAATAGVLVVGMNVIAAIV